MTNKIQLMLMTAWCNSHGKDFESGGLEWIALYASAFRSIINRGKL
jgi:hypothetical protein